MPATSDTVRNWLKALGSLTAGSLPEHEAQAKLGAYVPMLANELNDVAFNPESLAFVARRCKFFPSYAEICDHLGEWWRDRAPPANALSGPDNGLSPMDKSWVRFFRMREKEGFGAVGEKYKPTSRATCLSLIKAQSPKAYAEIMEEGRYDFR